METDVLLAQALHSGADLVPHLVRHHWPLFSHVTLRANLLQYSELNIMATYAHTAIHMRPFTHIEPLTYTWAHTHTHTTYTLVSYLQELLSEYLFNLAHVIHAVPYCHTELRATPFLSK